eukprot:7857208-Pyramimonas_sp.AAC.1
MGPGLRGLNVVLHDAVLDDDLHFYLDPLLRDGGSHLLVEPLEADVQATRRAAEGHSLATPARALA